MKSKNLHKIFVILGFIFINTTIFAQLNGTYTINSTLGNFSGNPLEVSGKNYSSFTNAVAALISYGVSGHVIFEVASNTYNEQISIPNIATASTTKTITFQSSSGNNADVILQSPTAGANYVVEFNGCSFVGFRNMTLKNNHSTITWGKVFVLNTVLNNCNGILIENNKVISKNYSSYDANNIPFFHTAANGSYDVNDLKIRNNIIENGSVSIQLIGFSSAVRENANIIENNNLTNFHEYGIYIENNDLLTISKNTIQSKGSNPGTDYGIYVKYSDNNSKIEKNKIIISGAAISSFGIYFSNSNVASSNPNIISNNIIAFTSGTGDNKGIYATTIKYTQFLFNTVNIKSGSASSYCFYPYAVTNSTDCKVEGNIFSNQVGGYAIKLQDPHNLTSCNYNCLYSTGTNVGYFGFTDKTFAQWQALSLDLNSINILPTFVSNADLHLASEQVGLKIASLNALVIDDIDNQARSGNPVYVGADEFDIMSLRPHMALSFSNSTSPFEYVEVTNNAAINFSTAMTAELWFKPYYVGNQKLIGKSNGTNRGWVVAINGGKFEVETWDAIGTYKSTFAGNVRVGSWYHFAFTWKKNGDLILYINGLEATRIAAGNQDMGTTTNPLRIGVAPWVTTQFPADGEMDEVRLWNIERTATEIFENAHKRLIGNELGLVAYYDFDHTSGNSLINIQGNAVLNGLLNANFELPIDWVTSNAMVPYIVNVSNISSDGFTLDWLNVYNVTNFYYDLSSSPTFATFIQQNVSLPMGTTFNVTGLSLVEGQNYYIRMWCDVGAWISPFTDKYQFKFMSPSGNNLNFDGVDDEIVLNGNYSTITNQITVEFWEYGLNSSNISTTICQGLDASNNRYFVAHLPWSDGNIYFDAGYSGGTNDRIFKASSTDDWSGKWTHWAFTKNCTSGQMVIYRNGEIWQSGAGNTKTFAGAITKFSIGASGTGTEFFKGKIDEFRVWNIERTQSDIQTDMFNLIDDSHANYSNLIEYFRFDQGISDANNTTLHEELISYSNSCTAQTINGFQFSGTTSNWNFSGKEGTAILTTTSVSNITATTADINMQIFSVGTGTDATSEYGAVWSSSPCPTIANSIMVTTNVFSTGSYTKSISGLSPSTTYYVRAYTKNTTGISYGETQTFATQTALPLGNALDFDGTDDYINVTNSLNFDATDSYTIECWVKISGSMTNYGMIIGKLNFASIGWDIEIDDNGNLNSWIIDDLGNVLQAKTVYDLRDNSWHQIAVSYDGSNDANGFKFFIDGNQFTTTVVINQTLTGSILNTENFKIGGETIWNEYIKGSIDELRVWDIAKTQADILADKDIYINSAHPQWSNLLAYYRFDQGEAAANNLSLPNELIDFTGNCNKGTLKNFNLNGATSNWILTGNPEAPIITTNLASAITTNSATLNGNIINVGENNVTDRGFVYSTSDCPDIFDNMVSEMGTYASGNYSLNVNSLSAGTTYYYRSFSYNPKGLSYGEVQSFSTIPSVPTPPISLTLISGYGQVAMQWNQNNDPDFAHYNIYVSENSDLTSPVYTTTISPNTDTDEMVLNLTGNVTYYFGVSCENNLGVESTILIKNIKPLNTVIAGFGHCASFDGVDDEMLISHDNDLNPGTGSFSIECWVKLAANDQSANIVQKVENGGDFTQYAVWVNGDDAISVKSDADGHRRRICFNVIENLSGNQRNCFTNRDIIDGKWHHIVCVADATNDKLSIWVDGIEEEVTEQSNMGIWPLVANDFDMNIMCDNGTLPIAYKYSLGQIDELRLWDYARTKVEIRQDMYKNLLGTEAGLECYLKFDENNYDNVWDFTVNEHHGKFYNFNGWVQYGAPYRAVVKTGETLNGTLHGKSFLGNTLTYSIISNNPVIGTATITNANLGTAKYEKLDVGYDDVKYQITDGTETDYYIITMTPVLTDKGTIVDNFTWTADTVKFFGDLTLNSGQTLNILKNTYVESQGTYLININGRILANGNISDSIIFTAKNKIEGWKGLNFTYTPMSNDSSIFTFTRFSNANNTTSGIHGGAFHIDGFGKIRIQNSLFVKNSSTSGGAIYLRDAGIVLRKSTFNNNFSSSYGGALFIENGAPFIANCNFIGNSSNNSAGALSLNGSSNAIFQNNVFRNNTAINYGGAILISWNTGLSVFKGNLIFENTANEGGGILISNSKANIYNSTIVNNQANASALAGGGICFYDDNIVNIYNSILWGNKSSTDDNQVDISTAGTQPNFYYCDIQNGIADFSGETYIGLNSNNIDLEPVFTDVAGKNFQIEEDSPCVNTGNPTTDITNWNTDLANNPRIKFCRIDMGVFESQSYVISGYTNIWTGCTSTDWHTATNWSKLSVPDTSDDVLIPGITVFQPFIQNDDANCNTITINVDAGANLKIADLKVLTVNF